MLDILKIMQQDSFLNFTVCLLYLDTNKKLWENVKICFFWFRKFEIHFLKNYLKISCREGRNRHTHTHTQGEKEKGRKKNESELSICWLTPQRGTTVITGSGENQEPGALFLVPPHGWKGPR